ncbi:MAG: hypothetical protein NVS2B12_05090 [Ktedonobacteraceae bacterium]
MSNDERSTTVHSSQQDSVSREECNNTPSIVDQNAEKGVIIWTPAFMLLFALTAAVGLSATTVLIQGWLNGHYADTTVLLAYMPLLFCLWLAVLLKTHSPWVRAGAIFGCLWSLAAAGNLWLQRPGIDAHAASTISLSIATNSALLGTFICLSLAYTPFQAWDTWFFRLLPLFTLCTLAGYYLRIFGEPGALQSVELFSAPFLLGLCVAIWWLRPSCWRNLPGPAFLFGVAPLLLLIFVSPNSIGGEHVFFFQQIFLLCILLGAIRILQWERQGAYHRLPHVRH